ncbi:SDR family oxidoreductase [Devosia algicola]|uniref:SDR family oxidoreductase n=1 Tax=Devosia algicola TaxID=3026418 RepID=A0ABY7YN92_9HYPH|nr:SDR family oxidoreductase [Devosia algicola]WDR02652.1 SDR family oxidoreductase [Devosia algicola]
MSSGESDYDWARCWYVGRRVLVTGGTSGIGAAIASAFQQAGAEVIATGIAPSEIEMMAKRHGDDIDCRLLDVRDQTAVESLVGGFKALDIVVNCAGVIRRNDELDPAVFDQVVDINLNGTMRVCAAVRALLVRSDAAAILNTASMLSFFGGGLVPAYAASKGGIAQLTKSLAISYARDAIRVNAVAPGWIATPLTQGLRDDQDRSEAILARTPLNRWGQGGDVAGAALFLCSPAAAFITGTILTVDGGYSIC